MQNYADLCHLKNVIFNKLIDHIFAKSLYQLEKLLDLNHTK